MKKEYVKPIMEGEAFVANEYIAACWTVSCTNRECGAWEEGYDSLHDGVTTANMGIASRSIYTDILGKKDPCTTYEIPAEKPSSVWGQILWYIFVELLGMNPGNQGEVKYHPVEVASGWTKSNHPNASV